MYIRVLHNVYIYIVDIHCGVWGFVDVHSNFLFFTLPLFRYTNYTYFIYLYFYFIFFFNLLLHIITKSECVCVCVCVHVRSNDRVALGNFQ